MAYGYGMVSVDGKGVEGDCTAADYEASVGFCAGEGEIEDFAADCIVSGAAIGRVG